MRRTLWILLFFALSLLTLYAVSTYAGLAVYSDGVKIADCTAVTAPPPPPPPAPEMFTWARQVNPDTTLVNPQPLYDQIVLAPGPVCIEVLVGRVHHVDWYNGPTLIRTENSYPYTTCGDLPPGQYNFIAKVYSDATTLAGTHQATVYVADNGAVNTSPELYRVVVEWEPPAARMNGEPLRPEDLSGHVLMYGLVRRFFPISEKSVLLLLPAGEYTFTLTAVDLAGLESDPSGPVSLLL